MGRNTLPQSDYVLPTRIIHLGFGWVVNNLKYYLQHTSNFHNLCENACGRWMQYSLHSMYHLLILIAEVITRRRPGFWELSRK